MNYGIKAFLFCSALFIACPAWAANYNGTFQFKLKAAQTTCSGVSVGDSLETELAVTQTGRVVTAAPTTVGMSENYSGYTHTDGFTVALQASCVIVPGLPCTSKVETFLFERPAGNKKKNGSVVWISVQRDAENHFVCSTVYTGTAKRTAKQTN